MTAGTITGIQEPRPSEEPEKVKSNPSALFLGFNPAPKHQALAYSLSPSVGQERELGVKKYNINWLTEKEGEMMIITKEFKYTNQLHRMQLLTTQ